MGFPMKSPVAVASARLRELMRFVGVVPFVAALSTAQPLRNMPKVHQVRFRGVGVAVSPLVPQRLDSQLRKELGRSVDIVLQPEFAPQVASATTSKAPPTGVSSTHAERLPEARALAARGAQLVRTDDLSSAEAALSAAVDAFDASIVSLENFDEFTGVLWLLAVAQIRQGNEEAGDKTLQRLLTLDSHFTPNLADSTAVAGIWKSVQRRVARRKPGSVSIATQPSGAMVAIDGRKPVKSPAKFSGLLPGTHYVIVRAPGMRTDVEKFEVRGGATSSASLALEPASAAADKAPAGTSPALASAYHAEINKRLEDAIVDMRIKRVAKGFAEASVADYVVLANVAREAKGYRLRTYLYKRDGSLLAEMDASSFDSELLNLQAGIFKLSSQIFAAVADFPEERDITTVVIKEAGPGAKPAAAASTSLDAIQVTGEKDVEKVDPTPPVYRRWWFWTAVGVLAAGGAGAGIYVLATRQPPSEASVEVSWQP